MRKVQAKKKIVVRFDIEYFEDYCDKVPKKAFKITPTLVFEKKKQAQEYAEQEKPVIWAKYNKRNVGGVTVTYRFLAVLVTDDGNVYYPRECFANV